jgi:hypothetical protein
MEGGLEAARSEIGVAAIEEAGHPAAPRLPQRLHREIPAGLIREEVEDDVTVHQTRTVLVDPQDRSAVRAGHEGRTPQVTEQSSSLGVGAVECEGLLVPTIPTGTIVLELKNP